jgi:hypothetical protein
MIFSREAAQDEALLALAWTMPKKADFVKDKTP